MKRTDTSDWPCPIARTAPVLGDHWNLLLLRQACAGMRRFDEYQESLGTAPNILTARLNALVEQGLMERVEYQRRPSRHEYRLTQQGRELYPILAAMAAWGERWRSGSNGDLVVLHHTPCDHDMHAVVVCSQCGEPLAVEDVTTSAGPGYRAARARYRRRQRASDRAG